MTFVDTSFFFAGIVPGDRNHSAATQLGLPKGRTLVTTSQIQGETWTLLRRREGHSAAVRFLDSLSRSRIEVVHLDQKLEREALAWLRRHDEREYSFVDATSFAFMRRNGLADALAFDGDFAAAGFVELRP